MRRDLACLAAILAALGVGCCADRPCETDDDCSGYEDAVCDDGICVCTFDELDRCLCDVQSRCDDVYGTGLRICASAACRECVDDTRCDRLERCSTQGECYAIECETQDDCAIGFCNPATLDCVGCVDDPDCPTEHLCRDDGACVQCTVDDQCEPGEVCDVDVSVELVEIVGTNQCGVNCAPSCRPECEADADCLSMPACVVEDPACLDGTCSSWDDCALPEDCVLRLGGCPDGVRCEALAQSFLVPIYYACLSTPCLYDFECPGEHVCYEGQCLPACASASDCPPTQVCVARVYFDRGACIRR